MFNCCNHGWSHIERECPKCFPAHITTSTSTTFIYPDAIVGINKSALDRLKAENARYRKALEFYADYKNWMKSLSDVHYSPAEISLDCGLRAKKALKEME